MNTPLGSFRYHDTPGNAYSPSQYAVPNDENGNARPNNERITGSEFKIGSPRHIGSTDGTESEISQRTGVGSFH
jgi:hypothetical protein